MNRIFHRHTVVSFVVRPEFDNYLVEQNRLEPGFTFLDNEPVRSVSYDGRTFQVVTSRRTISGRQLIGADGANGMVNRTFRVSKVRLAYALEVNLTHSLAETKRELRPSIDLCVLKQGYGWVFPKDDQWSVGLYTLATGIPRLKTLLVEYLRLKGMTVRGDPLATFEAHPIPIGGYRLNIPNIPVYVVGDAGGFADAILGEGIFYALESGRLAGLTAVSVAQDHGSHRDYYSALRRRILPDTFLTYWFAKLLIYGDYQGLGWRISKRVVQRILLQSYVEGCTFTQALLRAGIYIPKSFRDAAVEVKNLRH